MSELLLIDLSAIYWQAWHSQRDEDEPSGPRDVTCERVGRLVASHAKQSPGGTAIVCLDDVESWRRDIFTDYKAGRRAKPPESTVQLEEAIRMVAAKHDTRRAPKCEADDVIATLAARHEGPVLIATADKDLWQLVSDRVHVLTTHTREPERITPAEVVAKYGVAPALVRDWLALVGDKIDNVPGVPSVGEKTATGLLVAYGSIVGVMAAAEGGEPKLVSKPALRAALLDNRDQVTMSLQLVSLKDDAPVVRWGPAAKPEAKRDAPPPREPARPPPREDAPRGEPRSLERLEAENQRINAERARPASPPKETTAPVVRSGDTIQMGATSAPVTMHEATPMQMQTDNVAELAGAIVAVQRVIRTANKDTPNPFFKSRYADLAEIVDVLREPMAAAGLAYVQTTRIVGVATVLRTTIMHTSGQWIAGEYPLEPTKPRDPQALGSAMTYARRYALAAMMGVVADDDDDGNRASGQGGRR